MTKFSGDPDFEYELAIRRGDVRRLATLAKLKVTPCNTAILLALTHGKPELIRPLAEAGADVNGANEYGETPLCRAVKECEIGVVEELLQLGANLEKESLMSKPLTQAVVLGQMEKVELLLRYGANPNAHQSTGTTALLEATRYGYSQIARLLLDHGANPRDRGLDGIDATQLAERANREDLVILYATRRLDGNAPKPRTSNHRASRPKR